MDHCYRYVTACSRGQRSAEEFRETILIRKLGAAAIFVCIPAGLKGPARPSSILSRVWRGVVWCGVVCGVLADLLFTKGLAEVRVPRDGTRGASVCREFLIAPPQRDLKFTSLNFPLRLPFLERTIPRHVLHVPAG